MSDAVLAAVLVALGLVVSVGSVVCGGAVLVDVVGGAGTVVEGALVAGGVSDVRAGEATGW